MNILKILSFSVFVFLSFTQVSLATDYLEMKATKLGPHQPPAENELKDGLKDHLEFISKRLHKNPDEHFRDSKTLEAIPSEASVKEKFGVESEGIVVRSNKIQKNKNFELNYRIKINTKTNSGQVGPFNFDQLEGSSVSVSAPSESKSLDKTYENITLELGSVYIDLYAIEDSPYMVGNVYMKNQQGSLEYFGQTIIRKTRG